MNKRHGTSMILALAAAAFLGTACNDATSPSSSSTVSATTTTATAMSSTVTTTDIVNAMEHAIQDEYHAEAVYRRVIADFGEVWPFVNIVQAEVRHSQAVAGLYRNRGLDVPASDWNLDNVPPFGSLTEACTAAAQAERDNIALYDELLETALPRDATNVFTNNRRASLDAHLPAFESCAGN